MSKFKQIQEELVAWQQHNFPGRSSWMPLMGLGEELGELHYDKNTLADMYDAVGDCCIFIADYCNGMGYDLDEILSTIKFKRILSSQQLIYEYGRLCHSHLKQIQRIRMNESHRLNSTQAIRSIIFYLSIFLSDKLEDIAWTTWLRVKQRDWQKNPNNAHQVVETNES